MNVLEKILEEIEKRRGFRETLVKYEKKNGTIVDVERNRCASEELDIVERIIRSHMDEAENDGWISVSKRLPEPDKIVYVTVHCSEWTSDYDSDWVAENEKVHHEEKYIVNVGYVDEDGNWIAFNDDGYEVCCDEEFGTDKGCVYSAVTAWMPFPEPYKGE